MQITEQWILSHAPNPETAEDARALSEGECFAARQREEGADIYWAECAGSAPNPYHVSLDWSLGGDEPVYSCSCPSRQTPCKHVLGLMHEILAGKPFTPGRTPLYMAKVRAKEEAERDKARSRLERARKHDAVAREKRLERQLEGLGKAEKLLDGILTDGLGREFSRFPAQQVERLATELGNCGLIGARDALERAAAAERRVRLDGESAAKCRPELLRGLGALQTMIREGRAYLDGQLSAGRFAMEEPLLYELFGGEWDTDELRELGSYRKNARLLQISFDVSSDTAHRARVERGFWAELARGDVVCTVNERSSKPMEGGTPEDSRFELLEIPALYETPGMSCPRVWWDEETAREASRDDFEAVRALASARVRDTVEAAARHIREPLLPGCVPALLRVGRVGHVGGALVLEDGEGGRIELRDRREDGAEHASVCRLTALSEPPAEGDAIFGLIYYDETGRRYCLHPYSLVKSDEIIRLQY